MRSPGCGRFPPPHIPTISRRPIDPLASVGYNSSLGSLDSFNCLAFLDALGFRELLDPPISVDVLDRLFRPLRICRLHSGANSNRGPPYEEGAAGAAQDYELVAAAVPARGCKGSYRAGPLTLRHQIISYYIISYHMLLFRNCCRRKAHEAHRSCRPSCQGWI